METPSSTRRVTRSQTLASSASNTNLILSKKVDDSEKTRKRQQQDRSALIDITNDSPIVGLAMGSLKTPSSALSKKRVNNQGLFTRTPGSGEALLRGQVKTLLQKVEEEAELSKITLENRPLFNLQGLANSPINLLAPTPANTPQVLGLSGNSDALHSVTPVSEKFLIPQMFAEMVDEKKKQGSVESETVITRSLLLDFSEKSDSSECSSVLTYQGVVYGGSENAKVPTEDDDASVWSIQVNASSNRDEEEEEEEAEGSFKVEYDDDDDDDDDDDYYYDDEEHDDDDDGMLDEICDGISKISVEGPVFSGKHIRFVYNSEDEIEKEEEEGVLRLKGLPTPKGKHLRFTLD